MSSIDFVSEDPREGEAYPGFWIRYPKKNDILVLGSAVEQFVRLRGGDPSATRPKEQRAERITKALRGFNSRSKPVEGGTVWESKTRPPGTTGGNLCFAIADRGKHFVVERVLLQET